MEQERSHPAWDTVHHVAAVVSNVQQAARWYTPRFHCTIGYQEETWALLDFANIQPALVTPGQHPAHIAFVTPEAAKCDALQQHRDGTQSLYVRDPFANAIELIAPATEETA